MAVRAHACLSVDTSIDSTEVHRCSAMTEVGVGPQKYPCPTEKSLPGSTKSSQYIHPPLTARRLCRLDTAFSRITCMLSFPSPPAFLLSRPQYSAVHEYSEPNASPLSITNTSIHLSQRYLLAPSARKLGNGGDPSKCTRPSSLGREARHIPDSPQVCLYWISVLV